MRLFKIVFPVLALALIVGGLSLVSIWSQPVEAQTEEASVSGWAWSNTIGWIDMSGVTIDGTGHFSGYGWSDNIGWINFNPDGTTPENPTGGVVLKGDGTVTGWARAVAGGTAGSGGWDGWIKMSDDSLGERSYGVVVGESGTFSGLAWGGGGTSLANAVIGWIDFSLVTTTGSPTPPPEEYNLRIVINGLGEVVDSENSISCSDTDGVCEYVDINNAVNLVATPDNPGDQITWGGLCEGQTGNDCSPVLVVGDNIATVTFGEVEDPEIIEIIGLDTYNRLVVNCKKMDCSNPPFDSPSLTINNISSSDVNLSYDWVSAPEPSISLIGDSYISVSESGQFKAIFSERGVDRAYEIKITATSGEFTQEETFILYYYDPGWQE